MEGTAAALFCKDVGFGALAQRKSKQFLTTLFFKIGSN